MKPLFPHVNQIELRLPFRSDSSRTLKRSFTFTLAALVAGVIAATPVRAEDWPMHRHDPAHTGATSETLKLPLKRAWTLDTGAQAIISSAAVVGDTVYFGTRDKLGAPDSPPQPPKMGGGMGSLFAVNAATGKVKWRFNKWTDGKGIGWVDSSPAVVGDRVYFSARDEHFYCIGTDGKAIWRTNTGGLYNSSSPTVVNGRIYVAPGATMTDFISLRASDGEILWRQTLEGTKTPEGKQDRSAQFSYSSPVVVGNRVYTAATNGIFYAMDVEKGDIQWKFLTNGIVYYFSPTAYNGKLLAAAGELDPNLYAIDLNTGKQAWKFTAPHAKSFYISSTAAADNTVYIGMGVPDQMIYAVDATTGKEKWRFSTGFPTVQGFTSSPSIAGGLVVVGAGPETQESEPMGRLFVLDAKTGARRWSDRLAAPVIASPAISGHRIFVGTMNGTMVAYQDATFSAASPKAKPRPAPTRPKTQKASASKTRKVSTAKAKKTAPAKTQPAASKP